MDRKKSFILYNDLLTTVGYLSDEQAGILMKMILQYANTGEVDTKEQLLMVAFDPIRRQMDRDRASYEEYLQKQRENGKKGGRPKKPKEPNANPKNPSLFSKTHLNPLEPKKADTDTVTVNDTVTETKTKPSSTPSAHPSLARWEDEFATFWNDCPKKKAKGQARKAWISMRRNKKTDLSVEELLKLYIAHYHGVRETQYAKTPSSWLNAECWDDQPDEEIPDETQTHQQLMEPANREQVMKVVLPDRIDLQTDQWDTLSPIAQEYIIEQCEKEIELCMNQKNQ